jgi:hypothetical protein
LLDQVALQRENLAAVCVSAAPQSCAKRFTYSYSNSR